MSMGPVDVSEIPRSTIHLDASTVCSTGSPDLLHGQMAWLGFRAGPGSSAVVPLWTLTHGAIRRNGYLPK